MALDIDIYRSAKILQDEYGSDSITEARRRYDEFLNVGDERAARTWLRIIDALEWIHTDSKNNNESMH